LPVVIVVPATWTFAPAFYPALSMSHPSKIPTLIGIILAISVSVSGFAQDADTEFKLAAGYYGRQQWNEAVESFEAIVQRYPNTDFAIRSSFFLAESSIQQGDFNRAYRQYQQFLVANGQHPLAPRAMFRMGESAFRLGNQSVSLKMLEEFSRNYPDHELNRFALPYLGQLRIKRGEPQLAERVFTLALQQHPNGPMMADCQLGLGKALLRQGEVAAAKRIFKLCVSSFENNPSVSERAKIQLGQCALAGDAQNIERAEKWFREVIADTQSSEIQVEAVLALARLLNESERPSDCVEVLEPVIGRELEMELKAELLFEAAVASTKIDQIEQAIQYLEQVRLTTKNASKQLVALRFELKLRQTNGQFSEAIRLAEQFDLQAERRLLISASQEKFGREQYANNQFRESLATFDALVDLKDVEAKQTNVWQYFRALNLIGLERLAEAEKALFEVDQTVADPSLKSLVEYCLASVKFRQQNFRDAISHYRSYLAQKNETKDREQATLELAICLANTGEFGGAEALLQLIVSQTDMTETKERVVENLAGLAAAEKHAAGAKWYWWLSKNSQNQERKTRANRRLMTLGLDGPLESQSADEFQRLFARSPGDAQLIAAAVKRSAVFEQDMDWPNAIKLYQLLIDNPNSEMQAVRKAAMLKIASCCQKNKQPDNLLLAERHLKAWLADSQVEPASVVAEVIYRLAWLQKDMGKDEEANQCFERIAKDFDESKYWPDAAYRVVEQLAKAKKYVPAKTLATELIAKPNVPSEVLSRANFLLGKLGAVTKDWHLVESSMSAAVDLLGDTDVRNTAQYFLAEARHQLGQESLAAIDFAQLHARLTEHRPKYRPWIELRFASLLFEQDKVTLALNVATEAEKRYADFESKHEFRFLMARCFESRGRLSDARVEFENVVNSQTGGGTETAAHAQWRIGETFFHQEKYQDAIAAYYKVDSLFRYDKWRAASLLQAGKCQEHLLNPENATKLYEVLLSRYPDCEFALETKQRLKNIQAGQTKTATKPSQPKF
jgi:TolA-binding protein